MLILIILLPLISALTNLLFGRFIGRYGAALLSNLIMFINFVLSIYLFWNIVGNNYIYSANPFLWVTDGILSIGWHLTADNLTISMIVVVNTISTIVHIYSTDYMLHDPHIIRFLAYLSLFTFFMLTLIISNNFIVMFLGWEGVGLCSYLLISFWFTRISAIKSATKAIIVNRVGDFGLTIGITAIFYVSQSVCFHDLFAVGSYFKNSILLFLYYDIYILDVITILLFVGAAAKSAQLALHTWLPDAMEGPTPVSALIHAATMVTAGVFLIIKTSPIFEYTPSVLLFVTLMGATTCFFSATVGLVQSDIKKVIAYSTCSQLGYMFFISGLSGYQISLFHLINHAFFKALLFLSAGAIIHSLSNEQDMRRFGGLFRMLPITFMLVLVGSLSLMGFPFLTGYYSKDLIIEFAFAKYSNMGHIAAWLGLLTAGLTSFYSLRLIFITFLSTNTNLYRVAVGKVHELSYKMFYTLIPLLFGSIFLGYLLKDLYVGVGTDFWNDVIFIKPGNNTLVEAEFVPLFIKFAPLFISIVALAFLIIFYYSIQYTTIQKQYFTTVYWFLSHKWYFDAIYNQFINMPVYYIGYNWFLKSIDKGLIESCGPTGYYNILRDATTSITHMGSGVVYHYAGYLFSVLNLICLYFFVSELFIG